MALPKPFYRIYRPGNEDYLTDALYAADRLSYIHSYHLIEKDLKVLFDYISPNTSNENVFSHRIYELFFRCCTEFENNAKAILTSNGYANSGSMNIANDYFKINGALNLNHYQARLNIWEDGPLTLRPFTLWSTAVFTPIPWYQAYNAVKHDRSKNFAQASLKNLIESAAGLLIVLFAQYSYHSFSPYQPIGMINDTDDFESANDSLFQIMPFKWPEPDSYNFDWNSVKANVNPINSFVF